MSIFDRIKNFVTKNGYKRQNIEDADEEVIDVSQQESPEFTSNIFSLISFHWIQELLFKGYKRPLQLTDLYKLPKVISIESNIPKLTNIDTSHKYGLIFHAYKTFVFKKKLYLFLKISYALLNLLLPYALKLFLAYIQSDSRQIIIGILLAILIYLSSLSSSLCMHHSFWNGIKMSLEVRGALSSIVYEKMLKLSNSSRRDYGSGKIMNIFAVDIESFQLFYWNACIDIFLAPLVIVLLLIYLCTIIGYAGLAGFVIMVFSLPLNSYLSSRTSKHFRLSSEYSDKRVGLAAELIQGIRFLKMYAWEKLFVDRITAQREVQLKSIRTRNLYWILVNIVTQMTSGIVLFCSFLVYIYQSPDNHLTPSIAFVALTIFVQLRKPLENLPEHLTRTFNVIQSSRRIQDFLKSTELQFYAKPPSPNSPYSIEINNGEFNWNDIDKDEDNENENENENESKLKNKSNDKEDGSISLKSLNTKKKGYEKLDDSASTNEEDSLENFSISDNIAQPSVLKDVNIKIPKNSLVIVVGRVGSGKSSLVSALVGEIYKVSGEVIVPKDISYTTQVPFLLSATVRDNILFGKEFDKERYIQVLKACALQIDLKQMPAKDLTEIGERGINLSGGQKQRISLARALYSKSSCYILDEPLSAVDPHVGKHLFDHCIQGMMADSTRILITHHLQFIPSADHIILLEDGKITQGTYQELKAMGIDFESILESKKINLKTANDNEKVDNVSQVASSNNIEDNNQANKDDENEPIESYIITSDINNDGKLKEKSKFSTTEDRNSGEVGWETYGPYIKSGGSCAFFIFTLSFYIVSQIIFQGSDYWLTLWTQQAFPDKSDQFYLLVYMGFILVFIVLLITRYILLSNFTTTSSRSLHKNLLESVSNAPCQFFDSNPSGRILNRFSKDINDVDFKLLDILSDVLYCASYVMVALSITIFLNPLIILPLILLCIFYYYAQKIFRSSSRELKRMESISRSPIYSQIGETFNGMTTIRAFCEQERFIESLRKKIGVNQKLFYYNFAVQRWISIRLEFIASNMVFLSAMFCLFNGNDNPGLAGLAITTSLGLTGFLNRMLRQFTELEVRMNSVERLLSYIETKPEDDNTKYNLNQGVIQEGDSSSIGIECDQQDWKIKKGEIEFDQVEIRYRKHLEPSLKNISLKINENEKIGIVGRTGSGKSTFGLCIFRLVEAFSGRVLIDSKDISTINLNVLRSQLGAVPQEPFIFSGSVRLNLDPFNEHSDDEIWESLEKVQLKHVIYQMSSKLDTFIEQGGDQFSIGQKQLLCLCRCLLRKSKIILLDESTSSLDYESDVVIKKVIRENFTNNTLLTIAHRLDTIIDSDRILVIDKGELIEFDSPVSLANNPQSRFTQIINTAQTISYSNQSNN